MAASKEVTVKEEDLCCYICLELYDKPRTLPCLHSFCHVCLVGYAKGGVDKTGILKISCPICRADIQPVKGVEKWVESLPINFTLVSILSNKSETMSDLGNKCDQCLRDKLEESAIVYCYECSEKLCEKCKEIHKKVKVSSSHKLCDIRNKQEDVAKLELLKSLTRCPEHQAEEVRYICKDHDQLCCNECTIVSHRKCDRMMSIAKELDKMGSSSFETQNDQLKELDGYLDKLKKYEDQYQTNIAVYKDEMKDKLKDIKRRMDDAFSKLEQAVCDEFEDKSSLVMKESRLQNEEIASLKSAVKLSKFKIETANVLGQPIHLFLMQRISRIETGKHEDEIRRICDKMSKDVVQAVEKTAFKELEQKIASLLLIVTKCSTLNIPTRRGILRYKSWLEAVKRTDDSPKINKPDNSANTQTEVQDKESDTENNFQDSHEEVLEDEFADDNADYVSNDCVAEHNIPVKAYSKRQKRDQRKRKENRKPTKKL